MRDAVARRRQSSSAEEEVQEEEEEEVVVFPAASPQGVFPDLATSAYAASAVCGFGALFSLYTMVVEHFKWDAKSFQRFSVATKIPVEVFCLSGPLVLVSAVIYAIMAVLWLLDSGSSSIFFISASWSAIMIDMSFVCYTNVMAEICANRVDVVLHVVNLFTVVFAFQHLRFVPLTFILCGLTFWGAVIAIRVCRRSQGGNLNDSNVPLSIFRPGSP